MLNFHVLRQLACQLIWVSINLSNIENRNKLSNPISNKIHIQNINETTKATFSNLILSISKPNQNSNSTVKKSNNQQIKLTTLQYEKFIKTTLVSIIEYLSHLSSTLKNTQRYLLTTYLEVLTTTFTESIEQRYFTLCSSRVLTNIHRYCHWHRELSTCSDNKTN